MAIAFVRRTILAYDVCVTRWDLLFCTVTLSLLVRYWKRAGGHVRFTASGFLADFVLEHSGFQAGTHHY
jgi:hypothetical protein